MVQNKENTNNEMQDILPSLSIDCVVFGFHDGTLKILLSKFDNYSKWMLPGGFVNIDQNVDDAAHSILKQRTGLSDPYLRQFHTFGNKNRTSLEENEDVITSNVSAVTFDDRSWFLQRFVSVGYFALVDYCKVETIPNTDETLKWFLLEDIPQLYSDHNHIIERALNFIRKAIMYIPIGRELLPDKFTMTELRTIYETILGISLDRRNFQRKMIASGYILKLEEMQTKYGIKPSTLFEFNNKKYDEVFSDN